MLKNQPPLRSTDQQQTDISIILDAICSSDFFPPVFFDVRGAIY